MFFKLGLFDKALGLAMLLSRLVGHTADHQLPCMFSSDQAGLPHCLFLLASQLALIVSPAS